MIPIFFGLVTWGIRSFISSYYQNFSDKLTFFEFSQELNKMINSNSMIWMICMDFPDPDNPQAAIILLEFLKTLKNCPMLHIMLTGRLFSTEDSPTVNAKNGNILFKDVDESIREVTRKEFFSNPSNISQPKDCPFDKEETNLLHQICAAQLRAILKACGFIDGVHFKIYDGCVPALRGLNPFIHKLEFLTADISPSGDIKLISPDEINKRYDDWLYMSLSDRYEKLSSIYESIPLSMLRLEPITNMFATCRELKKMFNHIIIFGAGPLTPLETFPKDLEDRVCLIQAMSCAWNGSQNLLGTCFNNAVDYEATKNATSRFKYARWVMIPTESCKLKKAILTLSDIKNICDNAGNSLSAKMFYNLSEQWFGSKGGPQAIFDVIAVMPLMMLKNMFEIKRVNLDFSGKNSKFPDDPILGPIALRMDDFGYQDMKQSFPHGFYATDADEETFYRDEFDKYISNILA